MIPPTPPESKEPVSVRPEKKTIILFGIIFVIIIIVVIAAVLSLQSPAASSSATSPAAVKNSQNSANTEPAPQSAVDSPQKPVDFMIRAGPQEKCGLTCRQLTPTITNTGSDAAHNFCISITLYNSGGDLIPLNNGPSLTKCIGDIASGESKSEPIVIEADCGFLASRCIKQTLILKTEATCDETTVRFPDRTIAV